MPQSKMKRSEMPTEETRHHHKKTSWIEALENESAKRKLMTSEERWRVICDAVNNLGLFEGYADRRKKRRLPEFVL
jgi:hypothetical protein